jgi:hypothetical protein
MAHSSFNAGTPEITDDILGLIANYNVEHLGGGVVRFSNTAPIPSEIFPWINQESQVAHEQRWTYETDDNGVTYALNEDKNKFDLEQVKLVPIRLLEVVTKSTPPEIVDIFQSWEDVIYKCLIRYIDEFPMVLGTLWWRNRGHVLRYQEGNYLGIHNDNDTNYRATGGQKYIPQGQLASRQVLAVLLYLNDGVESEEELDGTNYTGGEMNFPYLDITFQGKAGDVLIFPANFVATHAVNTITGGDRYTYLEFFSQGSPQPEVMINVEEPDAMDSWCPPHWLNSIYDDYDRYSRYMEQDATGEDMALRYSKGNPIWQNRTLEGDEGLKQPYNHEDVIGVNKQRASYVHDEHGRLVKQ